MRCFTVAALAASVGTVLNVAVAESNTNTAPRWTVPPHWVEISPGPAMVAAYLPKPGSKQAVLATVNRLPGVIHSERAPLLLPRIELAGDKRGGNRRPLSLPDANDHAIMLDLKGRDPDTFAPRRLITITVERSGEEWLYKLVGDASAVASQKDAFIKFVQSARYQ